MVSSKKNSYQPIIIIGAARSGTNMLRDVLAQLPGFGTWPCDEINYIWRHGNVRYPNDEFSSDQATISVKEYISRVFSRLAKKHKLRYVLEKTCANSLRLGFIERIFPEAKFIFIVRDGRDVVASALKRWVAPLDLFYTLKKARYIPVTDAPYYAFRYAYNRFYRMFSHERRLSFWGPHFEGMEEMLNCRSLPEVCAMQWVRCVEKAGHDLEQITPARVCKLRYEDFATFPESELSRISTFLKVNIPKNLSQQLIQDISTHSIGKWRKELNHDVLTLIYPIMQKTLILHNYL